MQRLDLGLGCTLLCDCRQTAFPLWAYATIWEEAGAGTDAFRAQETLSEWP